VREPVVSSNPRVKQRIGELWERVLTWHAACRYQACVARMFVLLLDAGKPTHKQSKTHTKERRK
jgi:hypothetical protein